MLPSRATAHQTTATLALAHAQMEHASILRSVMAQHAVLGFVFKEPVRMYAVAFRAPRLQSASFPHLASPMDPVQLACIVAIILLLQMEYIHPLIRLQPQ